MKQLDVTGGEYFVAVKSLPDETVAQAALLDPNDNKMFSFAAKRIFDMLFDMYAEEDGYWSKMSTHYFI